MSRYGFTEFDSEFVVGWDNPLQTLFGQAISNGEVDVSTLKDPDIQTVDELEVELGQVIPDHLRLRLEDDMANKTEPTPLQKMMGTAFKA